MFSRRQIITSATAFFISPFHSIPANAATPFCSFSAARGWSERRSETVIYARPAKDDDRSGIPQVIAQIKNALGFEAEIEVFITNKREGNAYAATSGHRRILIADTGFLTDLNKSSKDEWAAIEVISHEIGHFIAGFDTPPHVKELNADYWSGYALGRLNCPRESCATAVEFYGDNTDTVSHPNRHRRKAMTISGWDDARENRPNYNRCARCKPD